jgi:hypothetical protein
MAHLTSRHSLTVNLSSGIPTADNVYNQTFAIQGPTDVKFNLTDIDLGSVGISDFYIDYGDGSTIQNIQPTFVSSLPTSIPLSAVTHTYYQTTADTDELTATAIIKYFSTGTGNKPLSTTHNVIFRTTPANMVEKNFNILNNQLFTIDGDASPSFNLESDENVVYPSTYVEVVTSAVLDDNIYINTNPESISLSDTYLYQTIINVNPPSDITTVGLSALSGSGFTIQGKSGNLYTVAFTVSGEPLRYTYTQNTTSILLTSNFSETPSFETLQNTITGLFYDANLIGSEFSAITKSTTNIQFLQTNLLPPEATLYTFTTTTSTTSSGPANNYTAFSFTDNTYSYTTNSYGDAGLTGLSAVNRMKTDPDALLIRAL